MSTIPASNYVQVLPNVLNAGGNALQLIGNFLTLNTQVPIGATQSFASALSVSNFFGASSREYAMAQIYFGGFTLATAVPGAMLFTQYPQTAVSAYLRGGVAASLTIAQLAALSGSLTVVMDGYSFTDGSLSLTGATSFSAAAALIQVGLNTTLPTGSSVTASIAAGTPAVVTGSIAGNVLTVTAVTSGIIEPGGVISGTGVTTGTIIQNQLSGTVGAVGTYAVSAAQTVLSTTITETFGTLTVTVVGSGTLSVGQTVTGGTTAAGTIITALGTGTGLAGTYIVNKTQTVVSGSLTTTGTGLVVTFDSTSGAFIITSGTTGAASTAAFATGTLAASLFLTQATGAVISQGSAGLLPGTAMNNIIQTTQNWAIFTTVFDPDGGVGNTQKQLFAAWVNSTNARYAYIAWDTDVTPTLSVPSSSSLAQILASSQSIGTCVIYEPAATIAPTGAVPGNVASFVCGYAASLNFQAPNGRSTAAYRSQGGLVAGVSTLQAAQNLEQNFTNYYGVNATAAQGFVFFWPGSVSGLWEWLDSYVNQIWFNNQLQLAMMELLTKVGSIPYNSYGYSLIKAAALDPITQAGVFGVWRAGETLSQEQIVEVNNAAGTNVAPTLQAQGWFFQIIDATPQVRQARQSPVCNLWYTDGESVQRITLNSIDVQ